MSWGSGSRVLKTNADPDTDPDLMLDFKGEKAIKKFHGFFEHFYRYEGKLKTFLKN